MSIFCFHSVYCYLFETVFPICLYKHWSLMNRSNRLIHQWMASSKTERFIGILFGAPIQASIHFASTLENTRHKDYNSDNLSHVCPTTFCIVLLGMRSNCTVSTIFEKIHATDLFIYETNIMYCIYLSPQKPISETSGTLKQQFKSNSSTAAIKNKGKNKMEIRKPPKIVYTFAKGKAKNFPSWLC